MPARVDSESRKSIYELLQLCDGFKLGTRSFKDSSRMQAMQLHYSGLKPLWQLSVRSIYFFTRTKHQFQELATITDDRIVNELRQKDWSAGHYLAEDPSLATLQSWIRSQH